MSHLYSYCSQYSNPVMTQGPVSATNLTCNTAASSRYDAVIVALVMSACYGLYIKGFSHYMLPMPIFMIYLLLRIQYARFSYNESVTFVSKLGMLLADHYRIILFLVIVPIIAQFFSQITILCVCLLGFIYTIMCYSNKTENSRNNFDLVEIKHPSLNDSFDSLTTDDSDTMFK